MPDNFELAREYQVEFGQKKVLVRVGAADVETDGTVEVERFKGEASLRYLAHALIKQGLTKDQLSEIKLTATQSGKEILASETEVLYYHLVLFLEYLFNHHD